MSSHGPIIFLKINIKINKKSYFFIILLENTIGEHLYGVFTGPNCKLSFIQIKSNFIQIRVHKLLLRL
jgi:hypothetical protein